MRTKSLKAFVSALLMGAMAVAPAAAQELRGSIAGSVKDASGAVLPGVTVEATNAAGVALSTQSDDAGVYRFPAVPTGTYTVTANLTGFAPRTVTNVEVNLGSIKKVDFTLGLAGVAESVSVTAESPIVDVKQSERSTHLRADTFEKLPKGRDFSTLVTQAPGANSESRLGGLSIDGSSAGENRWIVDGAESTNLQNGTQGKQVVVDFIEEVQVRSSGYTAEFGGATGGVVNVITKSGTNEFHGDVGTYFTSSGLEGNERPTLRLLPTDSNQAELFTFAKDDFTQWEPGFTLGGPIVRDNAWFFIGYQPQLISTDRTVTFTTDGSRAAFDQKQRTHMTTGSARVQLGSKTTGRFAFNASPGFRDNLLPARDGSEPPTANFGIDRETPNYSYSGNIDYVASDNLFFGMRAGYFVRDIHDANVHQGSRFTFSTTNIGMAGVPASLQRVSGFANVPTNSETTFDEFTRLSFQVDGAYYANFAGQHQFKAGVQIDRLGNNVLSGETGNRVTLQWGRALSGERGTFGYYQVRSNGKIPSLGFITEGDVSVNNLGLFIQDAWTIGNRLTLNLGLRTENETVPSYTTGEGITPEAIEFSFAQKLAPRVGFAYDIKGDGRWKAFGNWGIFYDIFKLELPRGSFGGDKWLEYYYALDTPDWPNLIVPGCPPACPGRLLRGPIDFRHPSNAPDANTIDPDLDPMKMQELSLGIEHELNPRVAVSVRYVHKQLDTAIEDVGALDAQQNEIYKIANPGFGTTATFFPADSSTSLPFPKAVRDYDGVEFTLDKRYADNWGLRVSYLLSRLYGNYSGLSQSDENGRTSPNIGRVFDYPLMMFSDDGQPVLGRLATDRPHQFKTQLMYTAPFGTSVGISQYLESGVPITREASFIPPNNFPVQYQGRESDGRTDVYSRTDLLLQHEIGVMGGRRLLVSMNIDNLFDEDQATNAWQTLTASGQGVNVTELQFYQGVDTEALLAQQSVPRDPRFLMPRSFQGPRVIRFGIKWMF